MHKYGQSYDNAVTCDRCASARDIWMNPVTPAHLSARLTSRGVCARSARWKRKPRRTPGFLRHMAARPLAPRQTAVLVRQKRNGHEENNAPASQLRVEETVPCPFKSV